MSVPIHRHRSTYVPPPDVPPENILAELIKRDLEVDVEPECIKHFVLNRWDRIHVLAHRIHRGNSASEGPGAGMLMFLLFVFAFMVGTLAFAILNHP